MKSSKLLVSILAAVGVLAIPSTAIASPGHEEIDSDAPLQSGPEERIEFPAGLSEDEYFSLSEMEQQERKEADSTDTDLAEATKIMSPTATPFMDRVRAVANEMQEVFEEFPDVHTRYEVDLSQEVFSVRYFDGADPSRKTEYISGIQNVFDGEDAALRIEPATYLLSANEAVLDEVTSREGIWATRLNGNDIVGAPDPLGDGVVRVGIQRDGGLDLGKQSSENSDWSSFVLNGVPVEVTTSEDPLISLESRGVDYSPYSPGGRINNSAGALKCTTGFGWRRWSDNRVVGSTAAHCATGIGGVNSFYNAGNLVGSRGLTNISSDVMILTPPSGKTFASNVFVGGPGTSTLFPLKGAAVLPVGSAIAFSGAKTGSHVSSVAATGLKLTYPNNSGGFNTISQLTGTWSQSTDGGDSGGPWITSNGSNQAFAHGSHTGKATIPGIGVYSSFMDINRVSAALQSTIYTQ